MMRLPAQCTHAAPRRAAWRPAAQVKRSHVGSVSSYVLHNANAAVLVVNEAVLHGELM